MLVEAKIKADLQLGHVIKLTFNKETREVHFTQSKTLLWETDYPPFNFLPYHLMMTQSFDVSVIKDLTNILWETGVLYGCVLNYSKDVGYVYVTFHSDPNILHNLAKITLEARKDLLDMVKETWKKERYNPDLYSYVRWFIQSVIVERF